MSQKRVADYSLGLTLTVIILLGLVAPFNRPARIQAQDGEALTLAGLDASVTIYYDTFDVPHVFAETTHDLFMTQGYLHASERFWQMEWSRRLAQGRLAEIDANYQRQDVLFRTLNLRAAAEQDWEALSDDAQAIVQAYTDGVNAYLAGKAPAEVALEYMYLAELGIEPTVEEWQPLDSMMFAKAVAFSLSADFEVEIQRSLIAVGAGPLAPIALPLFFPPYPADHAIITQPGALDLVSAESEATTSSALPENGTPLQFDFAALNAALVEGTAFFQSVEHVVNAPDEGASNSWVVSGDLTDTGLPYLANDPHLGIANPGVWFEQGLHCVAKSDACPYDVSGVMFPAVPGVAIGSNDRIAWGMTTNMGDTQDLYTLTINPDNALQYQLNGAWVDFETRTETINVVNGDAVEVQIRSSVWGPVVSDALGLPAVWALRWTGFDPSTLVESFFALNRAQNWDEFLAAVEKFDVGPHNVTYADVDNNIGYKQSGRIPLRAAGHDPSMPADGSTDAMAWQGYIPTLELPELFNPASGYIVTANNRVVGDDYPYFLASQYDWGYRATRIETLLQNDADGIFTLDEMLAMQTDNYNANAATLVPALQELTFDDPALAEIVAWLGEWDRNNDQASPQAALFETLWQELTALTLNDDLGTAFATINADSRRFWEVFRVLLTDKANPIYGRLWDNGDTEDVVETADDILQAALASAYAKMVEAQGDDPSQWSWGKLHLTRWIAKPLGVIGSPEVQSLFNREVETGGGAGILNASGYGPTSFVTVHGASYRQVIDLSNQDNNRYIMLLGQSGDPTSPHYSDQIQLWADGDYRTFGFTREAIEANAVRTVILNPA